MQRPPQGASAWLHWLAALPALAACTGCLHWLAPPGEPKLLRYSVTIITRNNSLRQAPCCCISVFLLWLLCYGRIRKDFQDGNKKYDHNMSATEKTKYDHNMSATEKTTFDNSFSVRTSDWTGLDTGSIFIWISYSKCAPQLRHNLWRN